MPLYTGAYLRHSRTGWLQPGPFVDMLSQSLALYETMLVQGFYLFSGTSLPAMNRSLWEAWGLPSHLQSMYWPWLGAASVAVLDATTAAPISDALVQVLYNGTTLVTRKLTSAEGTIAFGGWCGKTQRVPHTVLVNASAYVPITALVQLECGQQTDAIIHMTRRAPPLPALALDPSRVTIGGISSGADLAANYMLAHSSTTLGAAIWAGNAPRCYVTRFAGDTLVPCTDLPEGLTTAGCPNGIDANQVARASSWDALLL